MSKDSIQCSLSPLSGNVFVFDVERDELLAVMHNTITDVGKQRIARFLVGESITSPTHIAIGNKAAAFTESPSGFTELKAEFERAAISNKLRSSPVTARLVALFGSGTGTGEIREFGLFDSAETTVTVDDAESTTGWTSNGTVTLDTSDYREGSASLSVSDITGDGTAKLLFRHTTKSVDVTSMSESDYYQLWFYIDDTSKLTGINTVKFGVGDSATNYYVHAVSPSDLSNGWNWVQVKFSDMAKVGSPSMFTAGTLSFIDVEATIATGQTPTTKIDKLRIFSPTGNLWARAEPNATIAKGINQIIGIYWFMALAEGADSITYKAFAKEKLTIGTTATSLTSSIHSPSGESGARRAYIFAGSQPVRYWKTGDTPTATSGHLLLPMSPLVIDGNDDITNIRFVRDSNAATNATLFVEYHR